MVRQAWSAGALATHGPTISGLHRISSLHPTLCWTRVEDIYFIGVILGGLYLKYFVICVKINVTSQGISVSLDPHFTWTSSSSVSCPKAGPPLQVEKPRLQFCRRQVFHRKLRNQGCSFTRDLIGVVAPRCFLHPTLYLASVQVLKDLKRSQGHQRGGEESGFG